MTYTPWAYVDQIWPFFFPIRFLLILWTGYWWNSFLLKPISDFCGKLTLWISLSHFCSSRHRPWARGLHFSLVDSWVSLINITIHTCKSDMEYFPVVRQLLGNKTRHKPVHNSLTTSEILKESYGIYSFCWATVVSQCTLLRRRTATVKMSGV